MLGVVAFAAVAVGSAVAAIVAAAVVMVVIAAASSEAVEAAAAVSGNYFSGTFCHNFQVFVSLDVGTVEVGPRVVEGTFAAAVGGNFDP